MSETTAETKTRRRTAKKKVARRAKAKPEVAAAEEAAQKVADAKAEEKAARDAQKAAEKAAAKAKSAAEKAKKTKAREAEKAKREAEQKRFREATLNALDKDAKQINARFAAIERSEKRTDDQRLACAILLASAKERCREAKVNYKEWCEDHLQLPPKVEGGEPRRLGYESIRKLLPIGVAENEEEGAGLKMLEDMRESNAQRNRELRERKAAEKAEREEAEAEPVDTSARLNKIRKELDELEKDDWDEFMETQANTADKVLVDKEAAADLEGTAMDRAKRAFNRLSSKNMMAFAEWVAGEVGYALVEEDEVEA